MVMRKQLDQARQKEERLRLQAYKEALDIKVFEEELQASRSRKGGANPVIEMTLPPLLTLSPSIADADVTDGESNKVRLTNFKFCSNQHPLRFTAHGKNAFVPVFIGTAADKPVKPLICPNKKGDYFDTISFYSWMDCSMCKARGVQFCCRCCYQYICSGCFEGDRRAKELDKADPAKHETYLKCSNSCNFTLQIPTTGGADPTTGDFTMTLQVRFDKLPPAGQVQSLIRFSVPDVAQVFISLFVCY